MATLITLRCDIVGDDDPDISYLQQPEFKERLAAYDAGEFYLVGVRAVAVIRYEREHDMRGGIAELATGGVWGIEDDSGRDYFDEVYGGELPTLRSMLDELGVTYTSETFRTAEQKGSAQSCFSPTD
jgi:hypothetical protein